MMGWPALMISRAKALRRPNRMRLSTLFNPSTPQIGLKTKTDYSHRFATGGPGFHEAQGTSRDTLPGAGGSGEQSARYA